MSGIFRPSQPAELTPSPSDMRRMQRIVKLPLGTESLILAENPVNVFFPDQNPAKSEAIHPVIACSGKVVGIAASGIVKIKMVFFCHEWPALS